MSKHLDIDRCPWCETAYPTMEIVWVSDACESLFEEEDGPIGHWRVYMCTRCHKLVLEGDLRNETVLLPDTELKVDKSVPGRAAGFLRQAQNSIDSPDASIMVCASALDVMLQEKGLPKSEGNLNSRIDKAARRHLITEGMAKWAHHIRADANDSRHPDEKPPTPEEAKQTLEFALALAEILFVLPARVKKGIKETTSKEKEGGD